MIMTHFLQQPKNKLFIYNCKIPQDTTMVNNSFTSTKNKTQTDNSIYILLPNMFSTDAMSGGDF